MGDELESIGTSREMLERFGLRHAKAIREAKSIAEQCGIPWPKFVEFFQRAGCPNLVELDTWLNSQHVITVAERLGINLDDIDWQEVIDQLGPVFDQLQEMCDK